MFSDKCYFCHLFYKYVSSYYSAVVIHFCTHFCGSNTELHQLRLWLLLRFSECFLLVASIFRSITESPSRYMTEDSTCPFIYILIFSEFLLLLFLTSLPHVAASHYTIS